MNIVLFRSVPVESVLPGEVIRVQNRSGQMTLYTVDTSTRTLNETIELAGWPVGRGAGRRVFLRFPLGTMIALMPTGDEFKTLIELMQTAVADSEWSVAGDDDALVATPVDD